MVRSNHLTGVAKLLLTAKPIRYVRRTGVHPRSDSVFRPSFGMARADVVVLVGLGVILSSLVMLFLPCSIDRDRRGQWSTNLIEPIVAARYNLLSDNGARQ